MQVEALEQLAADAQRLGHQVAVAQAQEVEGDQRDREPLGQHAGAVGTGDVHALGQGGEARDTVGERHDLAVEQRVVDGQHP